MSTHISKTCSSALHQLHNIRKIRRYLSHEGTETGAVYLELLTSLETSKFILSLKRFIARRGRPRVIYTDNGSTSQAAADWMTKVQKEERFHSYLNQHDTRWKFNLCQAPWLQQARQFERLIGVLKSAFWKVLGNETLSWSELADVLLDVGVTINHRPLSYVKKDAELWRNVSENPFVLRPL